MTRMLKGVAICGLLAAAVAASGAGRLLPLGAVTPPPVPVALAASPIGGRVQLVLVPSRDLVRGLAAGLSRSQVALQRDGALALVDGRVFATGPSSAREVIRTLSWEEQPMEVRQLRREPVRFAAPHAAPLLWCARRDAYLTLRWTRDYVAGNPSFAVVFLVCAVLFLLHEATAGRPRRATSTEDKLAPSRRFYERPVRVVLVPDETTLSQLRVAIGEEYVVAATEQAFAFTDGWILAARKGSVFELMSELGWQTRPIELATRAELARRGHKVSPVGDDRGDTLQLLEALYVCGDLAHTA